jgi:hypothetical protein
MAGEEKSEGLGRVARGTSGLGLRCLSAEALSARLACRTKPWRRLVGALRLAQGLHHPDSVGVVEEKDLPWFDFAHHRSKLR